MAPASRRLHLLCVATAAISFILLFARTDAQNATAIFPFSVSNTPLVATLFPLEILTVETPILIRYTLIFAVVGYNLVAPCDKVALNFWGERETLPGEICKNPELFARVNVYGLLRALELEFPQQALAYGQLMQQNGLDPDDRSTDKSTAAGIGNAAGIRVAQWFARDGWNSLGDITSDNYRQPFKDFTNYRPVNPPNKLRFPLRWQPLTQNKGFGRFASQVHVTPFLGTRRPLVLSAKEVASRRAPEPYKNLNAKTLLPSDSQKLDYLIDELFRTSAGLTVKQRVQARFWENKAISLGAIPGFYLPQINFDDIFSATRWFFGEMLAQHDALIVAWKEKRRIDSVRPPTAILFRSKGQKVRAYVPDKGKAMIVAAEEWVPLIPVQPHSEYPSASATICGAAFEHAALLTAEALKRTNLTTAPPIVVPLNQNTSIIDLEGITSLTFKTFEEASNNCGTSRLWAGVHFSPSVPAGKALSRGIGKAAYEHVRDLVNGNIPRNCVHCTKKNLILK